MITTHIHRIKYIPLLSLCLLTSSFSSCQNAPQTNQIQLSSVSENRSIPLEDIIRIKTPGVFVGRTVQELNNNIRKEFPNLSVTEENFKTQQSSFSSTSFTPDQINVINLANGDIRFKVLTKSIYTEVNILGESGDTVSFFVFYKGPSTSPLVSLPPSDPFSPQPNYRDLLLPPAPTSEVEVGGVLPDTIEIEIEWIPLMVKWYGPFSYEIARRPNGTYQIFTQSHHYKVSSLVPIIPEIPLNPDARVYFGDCRWMAHEDRLIHQNTDGNGILNFQNASFFNFCNIAVGPLNSKSFNLGKLISPLDVPANHEKPTTIDTYDHINGEDVLVSSENIFSPRDKNGIYDRLKLNVSVDEDTSWSIKVGLPDMLSDALPIGITGIGSDSVEWDGHVNGICMLDGQFEVFVVDNNNEILQRETFYIDNTPPVLNSYNIIERVIQPETLTQEEIIENDVTLKVMDVPYLNQQAAGITDVNSLNLVVNAEMDGLKIRDPLDFQILGKTNEEFTLDFTVDGRLSSRFLHVSFQDDVGNTQSLDLNQP